MDSVRDEKQKRLIETQVESMGKKLVPISYSEMNSFAGNMLFIRGQKSFYWACSTQAYNSLSDTSRTRLQDEAPFVHSDLRTIETFGGGGARCLLAEYYK
jgi:hypothetical protein